MDGTARASGLEAIIRDTLGAAFLAAGLIHVWAAINHAQHAPQLAFFTSVAAMQCWWAGVVRCVRDSAFSLLWTGAAFNAGVLVVWIVSRTVGIPEVPGFSHVGPMPLMTATTARVESVGVADTTASLLEGGSVAGIWLLSRLERSGRDGGIRSSRRRRP